MDAIDTADTIVLPRVKKTASPAWLRAWRGAFTWLAVWEVYPIIALATFLRFYHLSMTEFDADQAILYRLPREAVVHGLIPVTGTIASIGMINPPGYVYLLMPIAAFTANPMADVVFTALVNVAAVILTYIFTRRYFGRLAGTVAALLFATAFQAVQYSRFIWQPNLLPFLTLLFMLALFWGAVERRPGWLRAALPLLAIMLQMHATPIYLAIPLVVALVLAYKTVRWRDLLIGLFLFLLVFAPYFLWESATHFADIPVLLGASHSPAHFDDQALQFYMDFLSPYVKQPTASHTLLFQFVPFLRWERLAMFALALGGGVLAVLGLGWRWVRVMDHSRFPEGELPLISGDLPSFWQKLRRHWSAFAASPQRCGLLLLLAWQIPPLLLISHHTVALQMHYLLIFLPGPFILIGLLVSQATSWCGEIREKDLSRLLRLAFPALSLLIVVLQFLGTGAWLVDESQGLHVHGYAYDTLQDVQGAVDAADQLAQSRHLHHVYIDVDTYTRDTLTYLAGQMRTPSTLLNLSLDPSYYHSSDCLVLPDAARGPAVMLLEPADTLDAALLTHFASATLVSEPPRLGGPPFRLYIVQPLSAPLASASFVNTLTLDKGQPMSFSWNDPDNPNQPPLQLVDTHWTNLAEQPAAPGISYFYRFTAHYAGNGTNGEIGTADCGFSSLSPGEQLLVPFKLPAGELSLPTSLAISGSTWISKPYDLHYGPFHMESILTQSAEQASLQSSSGGESIVVQN